MPIKDVSNVVRIPRLGKIHLGIKVEREGKSPYPKATDYFVCPPEVQDVFGKEPRKLDIMFPSDDPEVFAPQYLRCYSLSQGLVCIGDGVVARRKVDVVTGAMAGRDTENWEWKENLRCNSQDCPEFMTKRCRKVMNLMVLLPSVKGLGVYQIDTSSFYSIVNTNSMILLLQNLAGRCSYIPLTLSLGKQEVSPPGIKKKTVNILQFRNDQSLAEIAEIGLKSAARVLLLPFPDVEEAPPDLFPEEVIEEAVGEKKDEDFLKPHEVAIEEIRRILTSVRVTEMDPQFVGFLASHYGGIKVIEELNDSQREDLLVVLRKRLEKEVPAAEEKPKETKEELPF